MRLWALIEDGIVINTIAWEGPEVEPMDFGDGITYVEYPEDNISPSIGWLYDGVKFSPPPLTEEQEKQKEEAENQQRLDQAQREYDRASARITAINQQLDDQDYSDGDTEDSLNAEKAIWTAYRIKLRAYIKAADGSKQLPEPPILP